MRKTSSSEIIDNLLISLLVGGAAFAAIAAPNSLIAIERPLRKFIKVRNKHRVAGQLSRYLKQQKLVMVTDNQDGSYQIILTDRGKVRAQRANFETLALQKSKWDGKWRIIMFDIPEKHKGIRDYLASHMKQVGFKQFQKSVFVFPYSVDNFFYLAFEIFPEISTYVAYMVVDEINVHNTLVREFQAIL